MLTVRPAVSITSLFDDPDRHYDDTTDQIASDNFILYGVEDAWCFAMTKKIQRSLMHHYIRVIYTAGYSDSTMPKAVGMLHACKLHTGSKDVDTLGKRMLAVQDRLCPFHSYQKSKRLCTI